MLHLWDTATGAPAPVVAGGSDALSVYVCGPTVSGDPHIGHGRFTLVWDVLRRYLRWRGIAVRLVSNVTDIDDKIIARAVAEGRTTEEVAAHYEAAWWSAMDRLGVERPDDIPHATAYVGRMVELIGALVDRGHAYVGGDGVYFASESIDGYGLLARQPLSSLKAGARVETTEAAGKRSSVDFVLWKFAKAGEPSWPSPWGDGRPGWHTECVVMSLDLLGEDFDLHGGGDDLVFPHHENERAQAVGVGCGFARHWVHSGMVVADGGLKMSKSLGNTRSLPELLDDVDPRAYRLLVLQSHYRSPVTVSDTTLASATGALAGLDRFADDMVHARSATPDADLVAQVVAVMDDDLSTPQAVALLFGAVRAARAGGPAADGLAAAVLEVFEHALGLTLGAAPTDLPHDVVERVAARDRARAARDWATSDTLRDQLSAEGWVVEDTPAGTAVRR